MTNRNRTMRRLMACASVALLALVLGCDKNVASFLLTPTGELPGAGVVSGRLVFGTLGNPQTLILMARVRDPGFNSSLTSLQVIGSLTGNPDFNVALAPHLRMLAPGVWVDTLKLALGAGEWKFLTNGAFDSPPDFGTADPGGTDGLINDCQRGAPGPEGNLDAEVPFDMAMPNVVMCTLDESRDPPAYAFQKIGEGPSAFSSTVDGTFTISGLASGDYVMEIRPPDLAPQRMTVTVGDGPVDLGELDFTSGPTGAISGRIGYDAINIPSLTGPPHPPTIVRLFDGVTPIAVDTTGGDSDAFEFTALIPGTYRLEVAAYFHNTNSSVNGIMVDAETVNVGLIQLSANPGVVSTGISVAGDFNNWDIGQFMFQVTLGVWTYTTPTPIDAGTYNMKFVTDFNFDDPMDYGGDQTVSLSVPITHERVRRVSGEGTALNLTFGTTGNYVFTLDEPRQTFTIQPAPLAREAAGTAAEGAPPRGARRIGQ